MPYRSTQILSPGSVDTVALHTISLAHDQRHLRRKLLHLDDDDVVMLDLKEAVMLADGDLLVLDTGDHVRITATPEALYEITPLNPLHLIELAWHLGNRHLPAEIRTDRILILKDPVIRAMLEGLGAKVADVVEPFQPMRGAYHGGHGHHNHGHHNHDHHGHDHGHHHSHD